MGESLEMAMIFGKMAAQKAFDLIKLTVVRFARETWTYAWDKVLPQGQQEVSNMIFTGQAYNPWPDNGPKPLTVDECLGKSKGERRGIDR